MPQPRAHSMTRRSLLAGAAAAAVSAEEKAEEIRLPRKVRVALLGLDGHFSEILDPLRRLPDVELAAVSDADGERAARVAREQRMEPVHAYTDYHKMLDRERLDMVAVCNNNGERAAAILACAERKLHVVAEKPLAVEWADLEKVKKAVERSGIRLGMLLPMRFSSPYLAMKQIVDAGEIGEVAQIAAQKSYKAGERPEWMRHHATYGGTLPWIGSHMVDLMRWSSGREFTAVASFQARIGDFPDSGEMENSTATLFKLDNGGVATLRIDYLRPETAPTHGDDRLRLAGTKGVVEFQQSTGVTLLSVRKKPEVIRKLPPERSVFIDFLEFVYAGKPTSLPLSDIYRVCEIVLHAREAAERNQILRA